MTTRYPYSKSDVDHAFNQLRKTLFGNKQPDTTPKMLIVAGVQGSGKTYLLEKKLLGTKRYENYVRLYKPEFRELHPRYAEMRGHGTLHAYENTEDFIWELSDKVFDYAFTKRYNIIMETALDDAAFASFPPSAERAGYCFEVHIVACKMVFSHWSTLNRGVKSIAKGELERFVPMSKIEDSQEHAKDIFNAFEDVCIESPGSQITLYERGFETSEESEVLCHSKCTTRGVLAPQADYEGQPFFRAPHHSAGLAIRRNAKADAPSVHPEYAKLVHVDIVDVQSRQEMLRACCNTLGLCSGMIPLIPGWVLHDLGTYVSRYSARS